MPTLAIPAPLFSLQLASGQCAWQHLPRGAEVVVADGAVCLHRREYLADQWVELPVLLRAGERHRVEGAGWLQITAVGAAQVSAVARPGWGVVLPWLVSYFDSALCRLRMR